jgi:hypothetical protein
MTICAGAYYFNARLNCAAANDDSYWIKVDNGAFVTVNGLGTSGWQWLRLSNANLGVGTHTFTVAYREDGAKFDKLLVTTSTLSVDGMGSPANNCGQARVMVKK